MTAQYWRLYVYNKNGVYEYLSFAGLSISEYRDQKPLYVINVYTGGYRKHRIDYSGLQNV